MMFKITGVDRSGKRFRIFTESRIQAMGYNLYRGSVWQQVFVWPSHKRKGRNKWVRIKHVFN